MSDRDPAKLNKVSVLELLIEERLTKLFAG